MTARLARILLVLALVALAGLNTAGAAVRSFLTPQENAWLDQHIDDISISPEANYPPFSYSEAGGWRGLSADMIGLIEQQLQVHFARQPADNLDTILRRAREGKVSIVTSLTATPEREHYLTFTPPYISVPAVVIVSARNRFNAWPGGFEHRRVAVGKGYGVQGFLANRYPGIELVPVADDLVGLRMLSFGEVDAAVADLASASFFINREKLSGLHVLSSLDYAYELSFAVTSKLPVLRDILAKAMQNVAGSDKRALETTWHLDLDPIDLLWARYGRWLPEILAALALAILAGAMAWILSLQRAIARKSSDLQSSETRFRRFFEKNACVMWLLDPQTGLIVDANQAAERFYGHAPGAMAGLRVCDINLATPAEIEAEMARALREEKGHFELTHRLASGELREVEVYSTPVEVSGGQLLFSIIHDVTERKLSEILREEQHHQQLVHAAQHDALTKLPNRALLADRLNQALSQSDRRNLSVAVVYLDLDGFKDINDHYGHGYGDKLLIALSDRMKACLREGDTLARIGGDEFVAILVDLAKPEEFEPILMRLLQSAATPVKVGEHLLQVSASIGLTLYPKDHSDADLLLRHADQAMYLAKQAGKNRFHLFDLVQDEALHTRHEQLEHIRQALDSEQFRLYFQPKVHMGTGALSGAEALIRWQHPQRGLLTPFEFLPLLEDHPLSIEMGEWVITEALRQISRWQAIGLRVPVSVNISARQLQHDGFALRLAELLQAQADVGPELLELEVLETSALEDLGQVQAIMRDCQALGVRFALDDFGTGYSSLTYLRHLPAEVLKIDRSFVHDMIQDPGDLAIVQGIVGLARAFGREVIAEGVETIAHGKLLQSIGCELVQGYCIARALPAADLPDWLLGWQRSAVRSAWLSHGKF